MEENDGRVPSVHMLNHSCRNGYTPQLIVKMEILLLDQLEWNLVVLTPRHFLDLFESGGALTVRPYEELVEDSIIPSHKMQMVQSYQRQFADFFIDLCLQGTSRPDSPERRARRKGLRVASSRPTENTFVHYRPSIVAAAALVSARRQLKITPIWPRRLAKHTKYDFEHIAPCADLIWRYLTQVVPSSAVWLYLIPSLPSAYQRTTTQ